MVLFLIFSGRDLNLKDISFNVIESKNHNFWLFIKSHFTKNAVTSRTQTNNARSHFLSASLLTFGDGANLAVLD